MAPEDIVGYSLRRRLGTGSVGVVWLVRDLGSGRHAALKRLPSASVPAAADFHRDLTLARSVHHPHLAELIEVRQTEQEWLLFSQYLAGGTLAALLQRRGPLSLGEVVTLIGPLAQALGALHRAGLTHGHLGPGDVMFAADGRPVLTDAGLRLLTSAVRRARPGDRGGGGRAAAWGTEPVDRGGGGYGAALPAEYTDPAGRGNAADSGTEVDGPADRGGGRRGVAPGAELPDPGGGERLANSGGGERVVDSGGAGRSDAADPSADRGSRAAELSGDLAALAALAKEAGGDPEIFTAELFSGAADAVAQRVLRLADPEPIDLGFGAERRADAPALRSAATSDDGSSAGSVTVPQLQGVRTFGPTPAAFPRKAGRYDVRRRRSRRGGRISDRRRRLRSRQREVGVFGVIGLAALMIAVVGLVTVEVLNQVASSPARAAAKGEGGDPGARTSREAGDTSSAAATATGTAPTSPPTAAAVTKPATPDRPGQQQPDTSAATEAPRWLRTLQALDERRGRAFQQLDSPGLDTIYVRGSPPWRADHSLLDSYRARGLRIDGLKVELRQLTVQRRQQATVVLRVVDRLIAGTVVDRAGRHTDLPPAAATARLITLTGRGDAWRISAIETA